MPARCSKTAPRFNVESPCSLWDYFLDYEVLAEAAQLEEAKKIQHSVIYLDRDEVEFWESLDEFCGNDCSRTRFCRFIPALFLRTDGHLMTCQRFVTNKGRNASRREAILPSSTAGSLQFRNFWLVRDLCQSWK